MQQLEFQFDGVDVQIADHARLQRQLDKVLAYIRDYRWHTLQEIADSLPAPHASVSAQLRNLRKARFGGYTILRRRSVQGSGLYEYRLA